MDIPEPNDPSGLWEKVKEFFNPFPEDSESVAFALADELGATAKMVERLDVDIKPLADQISAVWVDAAGILFVTNLRRLVADHISIAQVLRLLETEAREYGRQVGEV